MAQVHIFRFRDSIIDTVEGYVHEVGNRLRHMSDEAILEHTTSVTVPDEALEHDSYYVHPVIFTDQELAGLVDEAISEYRMLYSDMPVSLPAVWVRGEELNETWTLRQYGRVLAIVSVYWGGTSAHVYNHEEVQVNLGMYRTIKEAMEAVHKELGKEG